MKLSRLLNFESIIIQCHDNPDADALASGMAMLYYYKLKNKKAWFIYSGRNIIKKSNLILMINELGIDVHYVENQKDISSLLGLGENEVPELLVTVDCQYGEGNVKKFEAKKIAIIDHHQVVKHTKNSEIRPNQASCSTIIWDMLKKEGIDVNSDTKLATALYYGLMTDSGNFTEIEHPLDRDMLDELKINKNAIIKFKNANISQNELKIAGLALLGYEYYKKDRYVIVRTEPCDPNILGVISDMLLEVDNVDCCLVYNIVDSGVKISVRSCTIEVKANELAAYIAEKVGNGGGHLVKAGGFIERRLLEKRNISYDQDTIHDFMRKRMKSYFDETQIIYATNYSEDMSKLACYKKKRMSLGYVVGTDVVPAGSKATVRTLQGDVDILVQEDTIIMIGIAGEIYPTTRKHFEESNEPIKEKYKFPGEYAPSIKAINDGSIKSILPYAKACISNGNKTIMARKLNKRVKMFTNWDQDRYYLGRPGDYLAFAEEKDIYIIEQKVFEQSYELYQ